MRVDLIFCADYITEELSKGKKAIVIDTLRATSTIITALANRAQSLVPTTTIEEAKKYATSLESNFLICGERGGVKVSGFDLGNSPRDYIEEVVGGKVLVFTTSNGTKCFSSLREADEILVASLLNLGAICSKIESEEEILLCCGGVEGDFALDDLITAGKIISNIKSDELLLSDKALLARDFYSKNSNNLLEILKRSRSGRNLIHLGKEEDIDYIFNSPQVDIVPVYRGKEIVKNRSGL